MSQRERRTITIGPDVDLDKENGRLVDGWRLTNELAEEIADRVIVRHRDRPSVGRPGDETDKTS